MTAQRAHTATKTGSLELSQKFHEWETGIQDRVVERNREAKGLVIATLARAHHLQLGPPGVAKTYLVKTAMKMVEGARYMEALLHGYCVMEDIYGPISLKALDEDRYLRKTATYLPESDFFFGDEIFKASPTLLNTNLWALNERMFRNDGQVITIPLISAFFASNEGPEDPILQAFDDRIHLRYMVGPIKEPQARLQMFKARLLRATEEAIQPMITMEDIHAAHKFVDQVVVPDEVLETLNNLQEELARVQIHPTDRKVGEALIIIQATAFYNGRSTATVGDMALLRDMFWNNPKDRPTVAEKVAELASPIDKDAQGLANDIEGLASQVEEIIAIEQKAIRVRRGVQLHNKMEEANAELNELRKRAKSEGVVSEVVEDTRKRLHSLTKRLLEKGFRVPGDAKSLDQATLLNMIKDLRDEEEGEDT